MIDTSQFNNQLSGLSLDLRLKEIVQAIPDGLVLASSLGAEDQVLTHALLQVNPKATIFILDTGRLHQETYDVMAQTQAKYHFNYTVYYPQTESVQKLVSEKGPNSFYDSIENRKECCFIRKVEPLGRALANSKAWITGLRRDQAVTRNELPFVEQDDTHKQLKFNPLSDWTVEDVWAYLKKHDVPYNKLHDKNYPSIGCAPCTRAIEPGEDIRAGRWWWETPDSKECGLHLKDGKLVRKKAV